jgi:hypothetical protein
MPILNPLEIPTLMGFKTRKFDLTHAQMMSPAGTKGFIQTINRTSPFWYAEYTTAALDDASYNDARSFLDQLEGSINTFLAYDPRRAMPQAYKAMAVGSNPWGTATITAQDYANSTISLGAMTNGAVVTKGDYISVKIGNIWYLFRAQETKTAASNVVASLVVRPRPQIVGFTTTAIRYQRACIEMKMFGTPEEQVSVGEFPTLSFKAGHFVNRT